MKKGQKKSKPTKHLYNAAFQTMMTESDLLAISLINEMFGTSIPANTELLSLQNEMHLMGREKRITDSIRQAADNKTRFHIECESTPGDTGILIRVFEYSSKKALEWSRIEGNTLHIRYPMSGVLFLRDTKNTPSSMQMMIEEPGSGETLTLPVAVLKVSDYTLDDIFDRNLWFLLPFYTFNYWKKLKSTVSERIVQTEDDILTDLERIHHRLQELNDSGKMDSHNRYMLQEFTVQIAKAVAKNSERIQKGADEIMGKEYLDYPGRDSWIAGRKIGLEKGLEKGLEEGREKEREDILKELIDDGTITAEKADSIRKRRKVKVAVL